MTDFVKVARTDDIPLGMIKAFEVGYDRVVLAHTDDGFFAVADECTHDSAPISDGKLRGNDIMCTRHGARFDLRTGAVTAPPAIVPIDSYEVKVEEGDVFVKIED